MKTNYGTTLLQKVKMLWCCMMWMLVALYTMPLQAAFKGAGKPANGKDYYLYNVYQGKFLGYGNAHGTQLSLVPFAHERALKCTMEKIGAGFKINTHYSLSTSAWKADVDNYVIVVDGLPYVNSSWGDADPGTARDASTFVVVEADEGYLLNSGGKSLMFDTGSACTMGAKAEGFNADKALWLFISEEEYNNMLSQKRFTAAAMNVDGMPKQIKLILGITIDLNPDAKESDGATAIGQKLVGMGYDFIGVSEDFNYDGEIMAQIGSQYSEGWHRGGIDVKASTYTNYVARKTLFDTDGLNFYWRTAAINAEGEWWAAWNDHNGYTDSGADGLINKGFRYYCVTLPDGQSKLDVYIHHMDAETNEGDNAARESQLNQLVAHIKSTHNGNPILIMGDTNCRYTRDRLKALLIDALNDDPRFTCHDPWIDFGRAGIYPSYGADAILAENEGYRRGEVVDKIFYINNTESNIRIEAHTYTQDLSFVNEAGEPLADHWPCTSLFTYRDYDPEIDNEESEETGWEQVYLRNASSRQFLKSGGWWGTHAMLGLYGTPVNIVPAGSNGQYVIQTGMGGGYLSGEDPYMDQTEQKWTLKAKNKYYQIAMGSKLLCVDTRNVYGPNVSTVGTAASTGGTSQLWEIVTREMLMEEMLKATAEKPFNCTFLLPGANFDANDHYGQTTSNGGAWECSVSDNAKQMTYSFSSGTLEVAQGNPVAEIYNRSFSGNYESRWEVKQTLYGLPSGIYRITCQGFYRDGNLNQNNPGAQHAFLFARPEGGEQQQANLPSIYSAQCTEALSEATDINGFYVPDSMTDASFFFNAGYYPCSVDVIVEQGTLTLGLAKTTVTKSTSGWTCFDNFQLLYLGSAPVDGIQQTSLIPTAADAPIYDLSGRRLKSVPRSGIYIQNGRKVVKGVGK